MHAIARPFAISLLAALACMSLVGCSANQDVYAGRVVDDTVTLRAPALAIPSIDLDAGFQADGADGAGQRSTVATAVAVTGLGSVVRVTSVSVKTGEDVRAGQAIARLDAQALTANVAVARADLFATRAQVGVLNDALDTVASNRSTLATTRRQIDAAEVQAVSTRKKLAAQLAALKSLLAQIEAMGAGGGPPAVPPSDGSTGTVPPGGTLPDPAQLRAGIARLTAALAQIDAGLAKVSAGRAQLSSAGAKLSDARRQLRDLRRLAVVGVDGAKIGVWMAEYQRETAVLRSPVDGVVVSVVSVGDVLAPGATVAELRRSGAPRVSTWLSPEELGQVDIGTAVAVRADWFPPGPGGVPIKGQVTRISTCAEYPPTSFATNDTHMTRAIRVETTLSEATGQPALPPGTPVDVRFFGK
ncbi:MAG: HlyD family efflux transporter periplasmic adaptor subunit [Coriobacteriia bacterium]|nr:HlyD family efflux transporter periplasmic adaptor subunit [Coriobacteriia bacterium]